MMRAREFIMKDAYSFDVDEKGAEASYRRMHEAYCNIFTRLGLKFRAVEADTGPIGGSFSHEFMVLADTGEDIIVSCGACEYAANLEKAEIAVPADLPIKSVPGRELARAATPGKRTVEEVAEFLGVAPSSLIKTLIFACPQGPIAALVRGDHEINEVKLRNALGCENVELADEELIQKITGAPRGFAGPVGLTNVKIIADNGLTDGTAYVTGGNEKDVHLMHVHIGRDFSVDRFADLRFAADGDRCPRCGGTLHTTRGIEVGHIFKLGTKYSDAMHATYLDEHGVERPMIMGCYGIGVGRTVAAAIEQSYDAQGIVFPDPIAPFAVILVPVNTNDSTQMRVAETLYGQLIEQGVEVLLDDRDERPGSKFKDADLIGIPLRVTIGKNTVEKNMVDLKWRKTGAVQQVPVDAALSVITKGLCRTQ